MWSDGFTGSVAGTGRGLFVVGTNGGTDDSDGDSNDGGAESGSDEWETEEEEDEVC